MIGRGQTRDVMKKLVITGAAGRIGSVLRRGLSDVADELRLIDRVPIEGTESFIGDLAGMDAAITALGRRGRCGPPGGNPV